MLPILLRQSLAFKSSTVFIAKEVLIITIFILDMCRLVLQRQPLEFCSQPVNVWYQKNFEI